MKSERAKVQDWERAGRGVRGQREERGRWTEERGIGRGGLTRAVGRGKRREGRRLAGDSKRSTEEASFSEESFWESQWGGDCCDCGKESEGNKESVWFMRVCDRCGRVVTPWRVKGMNPSYVMVGLMVGRTYARSWTSDQIFWYEQLEEGKRLPGVVERDTRNSWEWLRKEYDRPRRKLFFMDDGWKDWWRNRIKKA